MATAKKWVSKENEKKEYKKSMGNTDYNIPTFGYKSSFLIALTAILSLGLVPEFFGLFMNDARLPSLIVCALINGFTIAYAQFFIQRNKGFCKSFYMIWAGVGLFLAVMIFVVYYTGSMM